MSIKPPPLSQEAHQSKHTPGPLKVVMNGTCSGAWAEIVQECIDPMTGKMWLRELAETHATHTEKRKPGGQPIDGPVGVITEFPDRFALTVDGLEFIANANLWAAAPEVLEALKLAVRKNSRDMIMTAEELRKCEAAITKATGGTP